MNTINMNIVNLIIDVVMHDICSQIDYNEVTKTVTLWSDVKGNKITLKGVTPETYAKAMEAFDSYA